MSTDATTLYKLMVLYMLDKVNFPLSNSQIADFMLDRQYTNYFTLQEVLSCLQATVLCRFSHTEAARNISLLKKELIQFLFFYNKISQAIRDDIDKYLKDNKYDLKCEVGTTSDYYKSTNGDFIVHCQVKEGNTNLIELNVAVPLESQADAMCARWRDASQDIYDFVMNKLM